MARLRERPTLWINVGLAAALVVAAAVALVVLRSSPGVAAASVRTTPVRTGTVTATVSGSGNVTSAGRRARRRQRPRSSRQLPARQAVVLRGYRQLRVINGSAYSVIDSCPRCNGLLAQVIDTCPSCGPRALLRASTVARPLHGSRGRFLSTS
jgi:hypothetical protein